MRIVKAMYIMYIFQVSLVIWNAKCKKIFWSSHAFKFFSYKIIQSVIDMYAHPEIKLRKSRLYLYAKHHCWRSCDLVFY